MTTPIGTVQGLASGIQWQTMIQQIVAADSARELNPVTTQQTADTNANAAWKKFQTVMGIVPDGRRRARRSRARSTSSPPRRPTARRRSARCSRRPRRTGAQPGTYAMQVLSLASAESLSGDIVWQRDVRRSTSAASST